ncbi:phage holin family protein [Ottowia thiooxydans]|uniref:phage holin family protein n=1 Tax=Ottowia thiooxydans TaxID=219182 RepID=UPI000491E587|nr:phage holin family protein [Ottowia thiooxydans]
MARPSASEQPGTAARVGALLADVLELAQVRFELFTVEAREELLRLAQMAMFGAFAVTFLSFGLIFLAVFLTVLFWDTHRLLALGISTVVFLGGGLALFGLAWMRFKEGFRMFAGTRDEAQRDQERLRS